ncbi:excinuclease ABC subunit C, partial [mine drainage metagenome]
QIGRCSAPCVGLISPADYAVDVRHVQMFLQGRSSAVIDELAALMQCASDALEFERAARLRDQIQALRTIQSEHYVQGASADMDVLACRINGESACVSVLFFRNGMALGSRDFFPRLGVDAPAPGALLAQFIAQYYAERAAPAELILEHAPEQPELLAQALAEHAGHEVHIKTQVRGDRARF